MQGPGLSDWLYNFLPAMPLIAIYIVGFVLALTHWQRARRAATLVLLGVGLMAFSLVTQRIVFMWLPRHMSSGNWTPEQMRQAFAVIGFMTSAMSAAGILLVLLAAFTGRRRED